MLRLAHTLTACIAFAALDNAPKSVFDWFDAARKKAPTLEKLVTPADAAAAPRIVIAGRAFNGVADLAQFEGSMAKLAKGKDVIAIDIGPREGEAIDQWLRAKTGNIDEILAASGAFGWSRVEARAWLDVVAQREKKPKIVGIATGDPKRTCTEALAFLAKAAPDGYPRAERVLRSLASDARNGESGYSQLDDNGRVMLRIALAETLGIVRDAEEAYTKKTSAAEYARGLRLLLELNQYEEQMRFEREGGENDPRGRIMAENALAALKDAAADARLFALVGMRDLARSSDSHSFAWQLTKPDRPPVLCIGTGCGTVTFRALDPNAPSTRTPRELKLTIDKAGDLENALAASSGDRRWILDLRNDLPDDESVWTWIRTRNSLRSALPVCGGAGETPWTYDLIGDFDALAWFPSGTVSALVR